jgi:hypothetical protein
MELIDNENQCHSICIDEFLLKLLLEVYKGWVSIIGIATCYGLDGLEIASRWG